MDSYTNIISDIIEQEHFRIASETASETGMKLFIVGGFVRDIILGRPRTEIDFLVLGQGIDFAQKYAQKLGVTKVTVFKNFGTAHFRYNDLDFEFVGARKESYNRNSRKPVVEDGTFEDDIQRRDFTINTLAISLNSDSFGEVLDSYNGLEDIGKRIIRTPLNPHETFSDDPLRIMRAFRFASQLNFEVSQEIKEAASEMAERLKIVSGERITDEFLKIMDSPKPSIGLILLYETGVMKVIFPEVDELGGVDQRKDYHHKDVFYHTCEVIDNIVPHTNDTWLRVAALLHDIAKPVTKKFVEGTGWTFHGHEELGARMVKRIFRRMKFPFAKIEYVEKLVRLHLRPIALVSDHVTDSAIRRMVVAAGEALDDLITLCRADITSKNQNKVNRYLANYDKVMLKVKEVEEKDELRAFQSPVKGDEIMQICNLSPGRTVGEIKSAIEDAILEGEIPNTYEAAYEYLLKIKDEFI